MQLIKTVDLQQLEQNNLKASKLLRINTINLYVLP